jgi:hypothetical protein
MADCAHDIVSPFEHTHVNFQLTPFIWRMMERRTRALGAL